MLVSVSVIFLILMNGVVIVSVESSILKNVGARRVSTIPEGTAPNLVDSIASGTQMAIEHCQDLFQWDRWNCPKSTFSRQQRLAPTKETAFAKAILAAALAHSITRNCSLGKIEGCNCEKTRSSGLHLEQLKNIHSIPNLQILAPNRTNSFNITDDHNNSTQWIWGGCSDNPNYGGELATKIVNSLEKGVDIADYVARHNSRVGIKLLQKSLIKKCRCHGISGSCTMKTCWMQVSPLEQVSKKLKDFYRRSIKVTRAAVEKSIFIGNSATEDFVEEKEIPGTEDRLIYLENSPDYCETNFIEGYTGTKGRRCSRNRSNVTKMEKISCRNLCKKCGHTVKRIKKKVARRCNCAFSWCCEVKCDTCIEIVNEYFCY